jgi:hypothetical protein
MRMRNAGEVGRDETARSVMRCPLSIQGDAAVPKEREEMMMSITALRRQGGTEVARTSSCKSLLGLPEGLGSAGVPRPMVQAPRRLVMGGDIETPASQWMIQMVAMTVDRVPEEVEGGAAM